MGRHYERKQARNLLRVGCRSEKTKNSELAGEIGDAGVEVGESQAKLLAVAFIGCVFEAALNARAGQQQNFIFPARRELLGRRVALLALFVLLLVVRLELLNLPLKRFAFPSSGHGTILRAACRQYLTIF
jgi:hypothetical protein